MTTTSSGRSAGLGRAWRMEGEALAASLGSIPSMYQEALRLMRRQATVQDDLARPPRTDPLLQVHGATVEDVFRRLLADSRATGTYAAMLRHALRAWREGADLAARRILRQLAPASGSGAVASRRRLALLHAALAFQGGQHVGVLTALTPVLSSLHTMPSVDPKVLTLVHQLMGICQSRIGRHRQALGHLTLALRTARKHGDAVAAAHALVDLALVQAVAEPEAVPVTLEALREALATSSGPLAEAQARALLRERLCTWAGSTHFLLIKFLADIGFKGLGFSADWDIDDLPAPHAEGGAGAALESFSGLFTLIDHYVDLTGMSGLLTPADEGRSLGLSDHPLLARRDELLPGLGTDMLLHWAVPFLLKAPGRPPVVQAALSAGPSMAMLMRALGQNDLAYFLNLCLDAVARLRGRSSLVRAQLALQRGFFLLADGRDTWARTAFGRAREFVLAEGVPWRAEWAQATLGLALIDHRAGENGVARQKLWRAYLMSRVVADSVAQSWRCANALSSIIARPASTPEAARRGRLASLLLDKLSVGQMLAHVQRQSGETMGQNGQWFPALRQAIATLVGLGRLAEAELVRDSARTAQAERLSRRPRNADMPDPPVLLTGPERRAWQDSGLQALEGEIEQLRTLAAGQGMVTSGQGRRAPQLVTAAASLWRRLPSALDAALMDAATRLEAEALQGMASAADAVSPAVIVHSGCVLLGYLVQPDELIVSLTLPDGQRSVHRVAVAMEELQRCVFSLRAACTDPQAPLARVYVEAARAYELLLAPVRAALDAAEALQVDVAPHEFLDLVPFSALWDGSQFMAERFAWCVRHPGGALTAAQPPASTNRLRRLQLLGAEDFGSAAAPLAGVRREIARIRADTGDEARVWMDGNMTAAALIAALTDRETDGVHIATHAKFDPIDEARSELLMGSGERVGIQDIRRELQGRPVQLLVLAACSTATTAPARDSIASAFLRAGVQAVLAAQWPLDDASAAWMMPLFYRALRRGNGMPPAQALQAAQLAFMHGDLESERWDGEESGEVPLPTPAERLHPRLWSPYSLFL